ncbi:MAG: LamG-like jellyroll fold domain-containing protein [Candidatus Paceibacterota bacterium]
MLKSSKGFTIIELSVAIVIIGIMTSIIYINYYNEESSYQATLTKAKAFEVSIPISLATNFVSEWKFDGQTSVESAATTDDVKDTWGGNNGTPSGPTVKGGSDCVSGKCLSYDGNDYIYFGSDSSLTFSDEASWTAEYWIFPTKANWNTLSCPVNSTGKPRIIAPHYTTAVYFLNANGSYKSIWNILVASKWQHIVYTCNGTTITRDMDIYVNGVKKGTIAAGNSQMGFNYLGIGTNSTYNFQGKIDNVRLYNNTLSASQVRGQYYAGLNELLASGGITKEEYQQRLAEANNTLAQNEQ